MPSTTVAKNLSGVARIPASGGNGDLPLVVAVHGGTYTSKYFDVAGYSLLDRASALNIPIVAIDRPGYGESALLPEADSTIRGQARYLIGPLEEIWERYGKGTRGIVLIAHSIGAAISAAIASEPGGLPLIGLAISGVGLRTPGEHRGAWDSLPKTPLVDLPTPMKDSLMFGPPGSFDPAMPAASHIANTRAVRAELVDIVSVWHEIVHEVLGKVAVPVHYRHAEMDHLWIVNQGEIDGFARALTKSPRVDAAMIRNTGHCMDFHRVGAALHMQQLGFALQCAGEQKLA